MTKHLCTHCGDILDTEGEIEHRMCEGCAIDLWEIDRARREQQWLEDDRNWRDQ